MKTLSLPPFTPLPRGYHWGAHVGDSTYWLVRDCDYAAIRAQFRPDLDDMVPLDVQGVIEEVMPPVVTRKDIAALASEAGEAGDEDQVALCHAALEGDSDAWDKCRRAIHNAHAMRTL